MVADIEQEIDTGEFSRGGEGIWGSGPKDVWISNGSDELAHFNGVIWESTLIDSIAEVSVLWGLTSDDIWGVGVPGGIVHYDGRRWNEIAHQKIGSPYLRMFHAVHGSSAGDVWVLGSELGEDGVVPQLWRRLP